MSGLPRMSAEVRQLVGAAAAAPPLPLPAEGGLLERERGLAPSVGRQHTDDAEYENDSAGVATKGWIGSACVGRRKTSAYASGPLHVHHTRHAAAIGARLPHRKAASS